MAGRGGRGRGRGMSFNVEALGFGRGESLPSCILQPPPNFPILEFKPSPLLHGEEQMYKLALKQEFRSSMRDSPYYIKPEDTRATIERYSDKYQLGPQDNTITWQPDFSRLPKELRIRVRKARRRKVKTTAKPNVDAAKKEAIKTEDVVKTLEALEKKENEGGDDSDTEEEEEKEDGEEEVAEEELEDQDLEEGTDYAMNYFDNGDNDGVDDEEDNLDEGAIY